MRVVQAHMDTVEKELYGFLRMYWSYRRLAELNENDDILGVEFAKRRDAAERIVEEVAYKAGYRDMGLGNYPRWQKSGQVLDQFP